jgi:hypothetical protein
MHSVFRHSLLRIRPHPIRPLVFDEAAKFGQSAQVTLQDVIKHSKELKAAPKMHRRSDGEGLGVRSTAGSAKRWNVSLQCDAGGNE